ncbi:MAG: hypothetical protein EAZ52_07360 [Alphaproteobacteria bacterium]|nr:MAG: hypothetical protein EAZ52_07360 [Alphaproteobacteria bacterium]
MAHMRYVLMMVFVLMMALGINYVARSLTVDDSAYSSDSSSPFYLHEAYTIEYESLEKEPKGSDDLWRFMAWGIAFCALCFVARMCVQRIECIDCTQSHSWFILHSACAPPVARA